MRQSPVPQFREDECYAFAREMIKRISSRPHRRATPKFLVSRISKPIELQEFQVRKVAQHYHKTFMVVPYGETVQIALR